MQIALLAVTAVAALLTYGASIAWSEIRRAPIAVEGEKGLHVIRDAEQTEASWSGSPTRYQLWP